MVAIGSDLDLRGVLSRIVEASCRLTDAEYGVLGIVDEHGHFTDLVPNDAASGQFDRIGMMPQGHGLLGLVPRERRAIRVDHVAEHPVSTGAFPHEHPTIDRLPRRSRAGRRAGLRAPLPRQQARRGGVHPHRPGAGRGARPRGWRDDRQRARLRAGRVAPPLARQHRRGRQRRLRDAAGAGGARRAWSCRCASLCGAQAGRLRPPRRRPDGDPPGRRRR
ncbi:GAF domain-containing protein [Nocardioides sp. W3-2-3]|uniref:GAF domain-containing protein n=1 Tax=Nocardioides convexus TaxID=2712224 RepID=UPI0024188D30|nr:GAF domain-containing protein [Nocardioides convexus]NHA00589.1 GAF domain-containing protein [Nocardioides convexus]